MAETPKRVGKGKKRASTARFVVGIGSSAGGLEALRNLFSALSDDPPMAFIVVQHLAPSHKSRLVEILAQSTPLRVKEVEDGDRPEAKVIYVTPPNADVYLDNGALHLMEPHLKIGPKPSVDYFFRSLAENFGASSIGVILSGTGSDGAHGIRAIKAAGGFTISQKASTAKYDGMPKAAKHTGAVDLELDPEEIAQELSRFGKIPPQTAAKARAPIEEDHFETIFNILERNKGACFANYKPSTVKRRVERRVIATRCTSIEEYADYLRDNPSESDSLFQDILISVTAFFRDPEAFHSLEKQIDNKIREKNSGEHFRCWIIGCATGEEAYSIAILVTEAIERHKKSITLQMFATDLDEVALNVARRGCYSRGSFDKLPQNFREKYFVAFEEQLQIRASLRDHIVFARHNIIEDPPFLNTELVSCRNVLIYFNQNLQEKVFKTICYSLSKNGILFLGKSETISGPAAPLFNIQDKDARIYHSTKEKNSANVPSSKSTSFENTITKARREDKPAEYGLELFHSMIEGFAPDALIIDEEQRLRHAFGKANQYLSFPSGEATYNVAKLLQQELGFELSSLIYRAGKTNAAVTGKKHELHRDGAAQAVHLVVAPLRTGEQPRQYLVAFQSSPLLERPLDQTEDAGHFKLSPDERAKELEKELISVKEQLQSVLEEHQASNEELQSLNEELQSANEELQSSNEELETTNEELQSSNEELTTLNQELNVKSSELQMLYNRHQAIQSAIVYPLVVIDDKLNILNCNPAARHFLRFNESDIGSQLRLLQAPIDLDEVTATAVKSLRTQKDTSFQLSTKDRSFEVQIQIFETDKNTVGGAVISFVDNTEIIMAMEEAKVMKRRLASIIDNTPAMVTMKDLSGVYIFVNNRFCEVIKASADDVIGSTDEEIFGKGAARSIRERDFEVLKREEPLQFDEAYDIDGTTRHWTSSKFILLDARSRPYSVCTISLDITDRATREHQLELFQTAVASANSGTVILEDAGEGLAVSFCSEHICTLLGLTSKSLLRLSLLEFLEKIKLRAKHRPLEDAAEAIESGRENCLTFIGLGADGSELELEIRSAKIRQNGDQYSHLILSVFDVTERLHNQQTILSQQEDLSRYARFSALGEIAAGISHEINTPLNVITANTEILKRSVQLQRLSDQRVLDSAEDIEKMAKGIANIVQGLKSVAGIDPGLSEHASMQKLIHDALKICEFRLQRSEVKLTLELPAEEIIVSCYPIQIMQVIINLVNNSLEAIAGTKGSWIRVILADKGAQVCVTIKDSGHGIDPNLAEKIMTPFFSTKKKQNGTGMGLSLSRSIARRHNGDLYLDPDSSNTTFCLEIAKNS